MVMALEKITSQVIIVVFFVFLQVDYSQEFFLVYLALRKHVYLYLDWTELEKQPYYIGIDNFCIFIWFILSI